MHAKHRSRREYRFVRVQSGRRQLAETACDMLLWLLQVFAIQLQPEDIVIAGTDGLFDNVFPEESAALIR